MFFGLSTITLARLSALNEKDIKKIVALSTLSQLGLIILCIGTRWVFIAFFHLITHAFFKAIIFIRVGNIIHSSQLYQSIKNTGIIFFSSPLNSSTIILARARLCGTPFTAAFFSKEPIIEINIYNDTTLGILVFTVLRLSITLLYSSRLIKIVLTHFNAIAPNIHIFEVDRNLRKGIFFLSLPSFSRGSLIASLIYLKPSISLVILSLLSWTYFLNLSHFYSTPVWLNFCSRRAGVLCVIILLVLSTLFIVVKLVQIREGPLKF